MKLSVCLCVCSRVCCRVYVVINLRSNALVIAAIDTELFSLRDVKRGCEV